MEIEGEPADALESPMQWESCGRIIGGDPVIRIVLREDTPVRMLLIALVCLAVVAGCQPKPDDLPASHSSSDVSARTDRGIRLHVWTFGPGNSKMKTIEPVTESAIRDAFNAIDWSGPKSIHSLVLSLSNEESISIDGVSKPENEDDTLRAHWMGSGKDDEGRWVHLDAGPLESPESALEILLARFNNHETIKSLASWK